VVTAHEVLHSIVHEKKEFLLLKLDYEKVFDKVNIDFLLDILKKRGLCPNVISWIKAIPTNGYVGVKLNNVIGSYFITSKHLRQTP
jgi:retron-type reverse transcriptase